MKILTIVMTCGIFATGVALPAALAAPKGKPGVTPPGVPPGQPFQALQKQIDALATRVKTLEAAAPQPGLMWINPLDLRLGAASLLTASLDPVDGVGQDGLVITAVGAATEALQVGAQVPPGFAVTGVKVCYLSGAAGGRVGGAQLVEFAVPPAVPGTVLLNDAFVAPAASASTCADSTTVVSVDPSAGGPLYVSLGLTFTGADSIVIRGIGLQLEPVAGP
jgi:hypothetical protein